MIGLENSRHPINQSNVKPLRTRSLCANVNDTYLSRYGTGHYRLFLWLRGSGRSLLLVANNNLCFLFILIFSLSLSSFLWTSRGGLNMNHIKKKHSNIRTNKDNTMALKWEFVYNQKILSSFDPLCLIQECCWKKKLDALYLTKFNNSGCKFLNFFFFRSSCSSRLTNYGGFVCQQHFISPTKR